MSFWWEPMLRSDVILSPDDLAGAGLTDRYEEQLDAEEWLSDNFSELVDLGVTSVTLFEDETKVYGPMSLSEA